jgi:hypothetical protein
MNKLIMKTIELEFVFTLDGDKIVSLEIRS